VRPEAKTPDDDRRPSPQRPRAAVVDAEQEEKEEYETPEGNTIEMVDGVNVDEEEREYPDPEEDEEYYPKKVETSLFGMMKKPTIKFII